MRSARPAIPGSSPRRARLPAAHKGLVHVAKVMAGTALDAIRDEALLARAKAEHRRELQQAPYVWPLPADAKPALDMSRQVA